MATKASAARFQVKFDQGLLENRAFAADIADLRSHKLVEFTPANLGTHDLEFYIPPGKEDAKEGPLTFRAVVVRRRDFSPELWERVDVMAGLCGGENCCVIIIYDYFPYYESLPSYDNRDDPAEIAQRQFRSKHGLICSMPVGDLEQVADVIVDMHHNLVKLTDRSNSRQAYRALLNLMSPLRSVPREVFDALFDLCPTINSLISTLATPQGKKRVMEITGQELGKNLIAVLGGNEI